MSETSINFTNNAEKKAFDKQHRAILKFNISRYDTAVEKGKLQYCNLELAKQRASNIKHKVVNNLDKLLVEFESNFTKRGGKVIWARDTNDAIKEIIQIVQAAQAKNIVKSKSMITEEIELNHELENIGVESLETDLGEYIVQLAGEKPYHIITPVMHKSKEIIAELFTEKFNLKPKSTPEEITLFVRSLLREKFVKADIGISGANFIIADPGAIALTENEGNALMSISFPKIHIAIVGIEKIIPSIKDFDLFWPLLATHGTGQNVTVYNSIVSGPKQVGETDGPEEMFVVLLDNRRTELLSKIEQRRALSCIRCGACLNGCPVYKNIGGHSYGVTYSGPIGAVITPHLLGFENYKHLSFASSLCGKCSEVCPVKINLHEQLLQNRKDSVEDGFTTTADRFVMYTFKKVLSNRWMFDFFNSKTKNFFIKRIFKKPWGPRRDIPVFQKKSFRQLWIEQYKTK